MHGVSYISMSWPGSQIFPEGICSVEGQFGVWGKKACALFSLPRIVKPTGETQGNKLILFTAEE